MKAFSKNLGVRVITYSAICIAVAMILSNVKLFSMPQGGTVTACSMIFVSLVGFWFGPVAGITAGVAYGFLQLALGAYVVHPLQLVLDYPLAFGLLGLSGFFAGKKFGLYTGYIVGALGRLMISTISGFVFFASYAPEGMNPVIYSLGYNASYIIPEMIITLILLSVPALRWAIVKIKPDK